MILLDFSGTVVANIMGAFYANEDFYMNEDTIRKNILLSLKNLKQDFPEYGKLIVCCDGKNYWRKKKFPYYKVKRKETHDESEIDWDQIKQILESIKDELREFMPFTVLEVEGAEADDIIAVLTYQYCIKHKILIVSRDKDLSQLLHIPDVKQYNPIEKKMIEITDPQIFLWEHVIKGDNTDGIPNILSPDNSLALKIRQKPVYQKKMDEWWTTGIPEEYLDRWNQNCELIDLTRIPKELKDSILTNYNENLNKKHNMMKYFMKYRLSGMITETHNFLKGEK